MSCMNTYPRLDEKKNTIKIRKLSHRFQFAPLTVKQNYILLASMKNVTAW